MQKDFSFEAGVETPAGVSECRSVGVSDWISDRSSKAVPLGVPDSAAVMVPQNALLPAVLDFLDLSTAAFQLESSAAKRCV